MEFFERLNKWSLILLVFSVTFENWDPFRLAGSISVTYMASGLYFLSWLPLLKKNFNLEVLKPFLIPLVIYSVIGVFATAIHNNYAEGIGDLYNQRVLQLILLMCLIIVQLYNDKSILNLVMNTYVASILAMYILFMMGVGTEMEKGRLLLFGENPNLLGMKAVIAFFIVIGKLIGKPISVPKIIGTILLIIPLLSLVIFSASRGALASIFLGLGMLIFYLKISPLKKLFIAVLGVGFSIYFFNLIVESNPVFKKRIMHTLETGDTGRNALWEAGLRIIEDNIFIGVGHPGVLPEMYKYSGRFIDPHNTFLYVFITTGLIGFIAYMVFILRIGKELYKDFRISNQIIYLVIFIVILFNMSKAGGGIGKILFWFFFALLIGSTFKEDPEPNLELK